MVSRRSYGKLRCVGQLLIAWVASSAAGLAAPPSCEPIHDPARVLENNEVVLLGEMHGTNEIPHFVASAACIALQKGRSVTVALEIPREEDSRLQTYLVSEGSDEDLAALLAGPFWQSPVKDGRSSEAMKNLIAALRSLRAGGAPVRVRAIDPSQFPMGNGTAASKERPSGANQTSLTAEARDKAMADSLAATIQDAPKDLLLVLTGNLHNRLRPGTPWDPHYEPMGYLLARVLAPGKRLVALDVHYPGGKASFCSTTDSSSCKPTDLPETWKEALAWRKSDAAPGLNLQNALDQYPYSGYFYFTSPLTASEPAVPAASGIRAADLHRAATGSP